MQRFAHRPLACIVMTLLAMAFVRLAVSGSAADDVRRPGDVELAAAMIESLGAPAGLCVHLGDDGGRLLTELSQQGKYLVHGLATTPSAVEQARQRIESQKLAGVVSVEHSTFERLPYADNLVNLLVASNVGDLLDREGGLNEILRVLRPGGRGWLGQREGTGENSPLTAEKVQALLAKAGIEDAEVVQQEGWWVRFIKPRPESMDEWTHHRGRDASFNPASTDKHAGMPTGVRWVTGPNWPTGYRKSALPGVVVTDKRLVYVFQDEFETESGWKPQNSLIARDAFNGLQLWRRPWHNAKVPLVSVGDRVFTTLEPSGPLVALDADTGELAQSYDVTAGPEQLVLINGKLIVDLPEGMGCLDVETGRLEWKTDLKPAKFLAQGDRVFVHVNNSRRGGGSRLFALRLSDGQELWSELTSDWSRGSLNLLFYQDGVLITSSSEGNHAISAKDGKHLWSYKYPLIGHGGSYQKVVSTAGLVWTHTSGWKENPGYAWEGHDPHTGEILRRIVMPEDYKMKHRCSYDVATGRYILCGSMDFADLETGEYTHFKAARNSCAVAGMLPANGLLYTFPHGCGCYAMLRGFLGLEAALEDVVDSSSSSRLETGPAYGKPIVAGAVSETDWPTYRRDARRTGSTSAPGPERLELLWERKAASPPSPQWAAEWSLKDGGRLSSPVAAEGLALVAEVDHHRLAAVDAQTGDEKWSFTAPGRIDCPPTLYRGLCLFGARDGWVYCLRAADGEMVWRFRAAPQEKRIVAYGQLESAWPVIGGVLIHDDLAYFTAGRHGGADGGIFVHAVEPATGELVWSSRLDEYPGVPDVLNGEGETVEMASWQFNARTGERREVGDARLKGGRLGLLNDAWYKRPIAMRRNLQAWSADDKASGQLLSFSDTHTAGYRACETVSGGDGEMSGDATLFVLPQEKRHGKEWELSFSNQSRISGLVATPERVYVGGLFVDKDDKPGVHAVRVYRISDGKLLHEHQLTSRVVHDGLAVAGDRVYVATEGGELICLGKK